MFLAHAERFLKIDQRLLLKNWIMTGTGTDRMQRLMSPVESLYIKSVHTEWINKPFPFVTQPVLCHCPVLVLLRPEPSEEDSSKTHTALCCQTHNMHTLSPLCLL